MKLLVGIPVFRIPSLVRACLNSLVNTPATVLVIDNAADADVKDVLAEFAGKIEVITSPTNEFCNGAWNRILEYGIEGNFNIIALGSSDAVLHAGWYEKIENRAEVEFDEVWIPALGTQVHGHHAAENVTGGLAGYFTFLPWEAAELVYPIPATLRHWFGDQYMFEKLRANGWKTIVLNDVRALHQQSAVTRRTPEAYAVIEEDKRAWAELGRVQT